LQPSGLPLGESQAPLFTGWLACQTKGDPTVSQRLSIDVFWSFRGEPFFGQDRLDVLLWRLRQNGLREVHSK